MDVRLLLGAVLTLLALLSSAAADNEDIQFAQANNYFSLNLLKQLSKQNGQKNPENLFFSPYSVSIAMAMLYQGSANNSEKQIESALGYQHLKLTDKDSVILKVKESINEIFDTSNVSYILKSGNALITRSDFTIQDSFKQNMQDNFKAKLFTLDFSTNLNAMKNLINQWCANQTNGKIDKLLSVPPSLNTTLALINVVYFKAKWHKEFDPVRTKPDTFYGRNNVEYANVSFMNIHGYYNVSNLHEMNATMIEMAYKGKDTSLFAILPSQKTNDLKQLKSALNVSFIEQSIRRSRKIKILLKFPKFSFKANYNLIPSLKSLGITEVFNPRLAQLSEIFEQWQYLTVDTMKHSGTIEVNEAGTEAAAVTFLFVTGSANVPVAPLYAFDHPFLFFIRHNRNGQILFIGEINKF